MLSRELGIRLIVRVFRGHLGRRAFRRVLFSSDSNRPAVRIQSVFRGHLARKEISKSNDVEYFLAPVAPGLLPVFG